MKNPQIRVRITAIGAPVLIFLYGIIRLIDVIRGNTSHGLGWNLGHVLFFVAFLLLAILAVDLRLLAPSKTKLAKVLAYLAMTASIFGSMCFLWGILGDLFKGVHNNAPVPGLLQFIGPLLFQVGMLGLLIMFIATRPRQLPVWSPFLVLSGFLLFAVNLNLLSIGALCLLLGLYPLKKITQHSHLAPDTRHITHIF